MQNKFLKIVIGILCIGLIILCLKPNVMSQIGKQKVYGTNTVSEIEKCHDTWEWMNGLKLKLCEVEDNTFQFEEESVMEDVEETGDAALAEKENDLREHGVVRKKKVYEYGKLESEYLYDKSGNEIETIFYSNSGSVIGRRECEYDEAGNKIETIYYNSDGSRESWEEYEYEYAYVD